MNNPDPLPRCPPELLRQENGEVYYLRNNIPFKILFIVVNAPAHPSFIGDFPSNIKMMFLPPNTISLIQSIDQGVIANFKTSHLKRTFAQAIASTNTLKRHCCNSEIITSMTA